MGQAFKTACTLIGLRPNGSLVHNRGVEAPAAPTRSLGIRLKPLAHLAQSRSLAVADGYHEVLTNEDVDLPELDLLRVVEVSGWP